MTAHFAIPATTFVLQQIVQERLKIAYGSLTPPSVSIEPPPRPAATPTNPGGNPQPEPAGIHLFLHHVAPNPAWRNMYEPHVNSAGRRVSPSPLAVDMHYMLSVTGADLEREVLLGLGLTALTRHGIVPRLKIESILDSITAPAPTGTLLHTLTNEPLHDRTTQPEQITIAQAPVDLDLSTKIWSALQSPLRPSAYFLVTTVFLDVGDSYPAATPVQKAVVRVRPAADPASPLPVDELSTTGTLP
ncbi:MULTISPECIES: Pvc16 family protein [unclassified Micromonospora]|uniref:Pvc16 family protein n=1 Tax=unclassified Micromonospora TaxID=2617518 RepID=UPI002FF0C90B